MNAFASFPARLHWNARQLADAVPLRLSECFRFDAIGHRDLPSAANREPRGMRRAAGYVTPSALLQRFTIR
jgi:hypothetical protein